MTIPPEVVFHRYFQTLRREDREVYRGKADIDRLRSAALPVTLLESLQAILNHALLHENKAIPEHFDHDPFHFDYVDSDEANALAFCYQGYSFIGVTIALLEQLVEASGRVSLAVENAGLIDIRLNDRQGLEMTVRERIAVAILRLQIIFVVLHEFTHVVHGHVRGLSAESGFANEVRVLDTGNLDRQARESDADGYAVYFLLTGLLDADDQRTQMIDALALHDQPATLQDESMLSCFIMAVGAFFFLQTPQVLTERCVYEFTHPPPAARMNLLMESVRTWCAQFRPALEAWLTLERFQALMHLVASATWGMNGGLDWSDQTTFLRSDAGRSYVEKLDDLLKAHIDQLGNRPSQRNGAARGPRG